MFLLSRFECMLLTAREHCGCVPWNYPREDGIIIIHCMLICTKTMSIQMPLCVTLFHMIAFVVPWWMSFSNRTAMVIVLRSAHLSALRWSLRQRGISTAMRLWEPCELLLHVIIGFFFTEPSKIWNPHVIIKVHCQTVINMIFQIFTILHKCHGPNCAISG